MKKLLITIAMLLMLVPAGAQAVRITADPVTATSDINQLFTYKLNVENDGLMSESFFLSYSGPNPWWISLDTLSFRLEPGATKAVSMVLYPDKTGLFHYTIDAISQQNPQNKAGAEVYLSVTQSKELDIQDFSADLAGTELELSAKIFSLAPREAEIVFEVLDSSGSRVKYMYVTEQLDGVKSFSEKMQVADLPAGYYKVKMSVTDFDVYKERGFTIDPLHNVVTVKKTTSNPFYEEVSLLVENRGNVNEDYVIHETIPSDQLVTFDQKPESVSEGEAEVTYRWTMRGLAIGKPETITYRIEYWPGYVSWFLIAVCVLGLLGAGVFMTSKPTIKKHYIRRTGAGEHKVILEVHGSLSKSIKNAVVRDMVSPLARVEEKFDGPKPMTRVSEAGTELVWMIGDLKPRGEILLSYNIRPLVEAHLKMPRANLSYKGDNTEKKFSVYSNHVLVESEHPALKEMEKK
jgi:hypothetical protein